MPVHVCIFAAQYYANAKEKKQLQIATLGEESDNVQLYTWILTEHNNTYEYDNMKWEFYDITVTLTPYKLKPPSSGGDCIIQ